MPRGVLAAYVVAVGSRMLKQWLHLLCACCFFAPLGRLWTPLGTRLAFEWVPKSAISRKKVPARSGSRKIYNYDRKLLRRGQAHKKVLARLKFLSWSEGCFSDVRGPLGPQIPKDLKNKFVRNCSHFLDFIFRFFVEICRTISLKHVPIYRKIHRIRIRYSK